MDVPTTPIEPATSQTPPSPLRSLMDKQEQMIQRYWDKNPDLYKIVQLKKQMAAVKEPVKNKLPSPHQNQTETTTETKTESILALPLQGAELRARIQTSPLEIRQRVSNTVM